MRVQGRSDVDFARKVRAIRTLAQEDFDPPDLDSPEEADDAVAAPQRVPYFKIGDVTGKAGEEVSVPVFGGCLTPINGFMVGGGAGHIFGVKRIDLGQYLEEEVGSRNPTKIFRFHHHGAPEPYWTFFLGFFALDIASFLGSLDSDAANYKAFAPLVIPDGTELFRVVYTIPPDIQPQERELYIADNWFRGGPEWKNVKLDITYTHPPQGTTAVRCESGKLTVVA